jgi:hypothetical protein
MAITRRVLLAMPAAAYAAQRRSQKKGAMKPLPEYRVGGLAIRVDSRRYQVVRAVTYEEFHEGVVDVEREEGRKIVLVELQGEVENAGWFSIPSNDFRAEHMTRDGLNSAPSLTFAAGDQPLRKPPPGAFFVANIKVEPGPLRFRLLFVLPEGMTQFIIRLPASLMRDELRKPS